MKQTLKIEGMMCNHCKSRVEKILASHGVSEISVDLDNKLASFEDNGVNLDEIKTAIIDGGFDVV